MRRGKRYLAVLFAAVITAGMNTVPSIAEMIEQSTVVGEEVPVNAEEVVEDGISIPDLGFEQEQPEDLAEEFLLFEDEEPAVYIEPSEEEALTEEFLEYEEEEMIVVEETTGFYEEEKADGPEDDETDQDPDSGEMVSETGRLRGLPSGIENAVITITKQPQVYSGTAKKPVPSVVLNGEVLVKDTDYTLSYGNNVEVGEASVTVTGKGSYSGSQTISFRIYKDGGTVTTSPAVYWGYDGSSLHLIGDGAYKPSIAYNEPWASYRNLIQSVVIEEGITELNEYAFDRSHSQQVSAETVYIAASVNKMDGFFRSPNLKRIEFAPRTSSQPIQFGYGSFGSINTLEEVVFPDCPVYLERGAFFNSGNNMLVVLPASFTGYSKASTYPEIPFVSADIRAIYGYSGTKFDDLVKDLVGTGIPIFYRDLEHLDITLSKDAFLADGNPHYPQVTLQTTGDITGKAYLKEYVDYTLSYDGRTLPGTAKITLTGIGYVEGTREITYQILEDEAKCGDKLVWVLSENGTLSINGSGDMYDYASSDATPWADKKGIIKKVVFKNGVTGIGAFACADMPCLEEVDIPETVTRVAAKAFYNTPKLHSLTFGDQITSIGDKAAGFLSDAARNPDFELLCSIDSIAGNYAKDHNIPNDDPAMFLDGTAGDGVSYKVRKHGTQLVFYLNERAQTIRYTSISSSGSYGMDSPWMLYKDTIEEVLIEDGIEQIYSYVFSGLSKVKELVLPESVTFLSSCVFQNMPSLETLKLPKNLNGTYTSSGTETIYQDTFKNLPALTTLVIPDGVKKLSSQAISGCTGLKYIYIPASVTTIEDQAIYGNVRLTVYGWASTAAETYAAAPDSTIPARKYDFIDANLTNAKITLSQSSYYYDGKAKYPEVIVKLGEVTLKKGTDYTVAYKDNVKIGTATVTVTGAGFVEGYQTIHFTIQVQKDIQVIPAVDYYVYDGKAKKPKVTVKDSVGTIASNRYTVTYSDNKNVGKATITVTLKAPYSGTVKGTFKILPKKTKLKKLTTPKSKQIKVTWKKQAKQTTGYMIQYSLKRSFASAKTITVKGASKTSYTIKNLKKGKTYYIRIQTYKRKNGVTVKSLWSSKKSIKTK